MDIGNISGFTPTAVASALYRHPGLLRKVAQWDGTATPVSERAKPAVDKAATAPLHQKYSFDPFDEKSWWKPAKTDPSATDAPKSDTSTASKSDAAAGKPSTSSSLPKFSFNPFDQASWWTQTKGTGIDVSA